MIQVAVCAPFAQVLLRRLLQIETSNTETLLSHLLNRLYTPNNLIVISTLSQSQVYETNKGAAQCYLSRLENRGADRFYYQEPSYMRKTGLIWIYGEQILKL